MYGFVSCGFVVYVFLKETYTYWLQQHPATCCSHYDLTLRYCWRPIFRRNPWHHLVGKTTWCFFQHFLHLDAGVLGNISKSGALGLSSQASYFQHNELPKPSGFQVVAVQGSTSMKTLEESSNLSNDSQLPVYKWNKPRKTAKDGYEPLVICGVRSSKMDPFCWDFILGFWWNIWVDHDGHMWHCFPLEMVCYVRGNCNILPLFFVIFPWWCNVWVEDIMTFVIPEIPCGSEFFQLPRTNHPMAGFDDLIRKELSLVAIVPWCSSPKQLFYGSIMEQSQKHTPYVTNAASYVVISACDMRLVRGVFSSSWTVAKCISQVAFCIGWNVAKTITWCLRIGGCSFWGAFISVNESCKGKLCKRLA